LLNTTPKKRKKTNIDYRERTHFASIDAAREWVECFVLDGVSSSALISNTITNNRAEILWGGGLHFWDGAVASVSNTIFWNNSASNGPEISLDVWDLPTTLTIDYCDVTGGQGSVLVYPGCTVNWGANMIDTDPLFAEPPADDFHLTIDSPCKAAGSLVAGLPQIDFEGDPRVAQGATDIGADEFYYHLYHTGTAVPCGNIDVKVVGIPSTNAMLLQGSGVLDPPWTTPYGLFFLQAPIQLTFLGGIPQNGILVHTGTIPVVWAPGSEHPFQVLTGGKLTNLMRLVVE